MSQNVSGLGSQRPYVQQKYRRHYRHPKNEPGKSQSNFPRKQEATESNVSALNMFITGAEKFFKAGQIKHFKDASEKLTSDSWILEWIQGVTIEFTELLY